MAVEGLRPQWTTIAVVMSLSLYLSNRSVGQDREPFQPPPNWNPTEHVRYAFTPNDPYYTTGNPAGYPGQWHLNVQTSGAAL